MITRNDIVVEALKWRGTPFRHQGRTARGLDCAGLVIRISNDLGLSSYDISNYPRTPNREVFVQEFRNILIEKPVPERKHGDILLIRQGFYTCHVAIYSHIAPGPEEIIHAYLPRKQVVKESLTKEMVSLLTQCFSFPQVENSNG